VFDELLVIVITVRYIVYSVCTNVFKMWTIMFTIRELNVYILLRPVDSTILFFQEDLVVVIILEYTQESRMCESRIHLVTLLRPFVMDSFVSLSLKKLIKVA